jgi:hypothetical protein
MRKFAALLFMLTMVFTCVACGGNKNGTDGTEKKENSVTIENATEMLTKVWSEYNTIASEELKFMIGGGDAANMVMDTPGTYDVGLVGLEGAYDGLVFTYCIPETVIEKSDDFATGVHMMMSNNFTTVGLHVTDPSDLEAVVADIKDATLNNQWMCGMPEKLIIMTVNDDYVITAYGLEMIIDVYKEAITNVYGDAAAVVVEENIIK